MFNSNSVQIIITFFLCLDSIDCHRNEYRMGYNDGFRDAQKGLRHRVRDRFRSVQQFEDRQQRFGRYERPDYESQDFGSSEMRDTSIRGRKRKGNTINYGNIFAIDENLFSKGFTAITGSCREKIKPEFGTCIERAANKFDALEESMLGENDCKALWDLMCCSTNLISKKCNKVDLKIIEVGFFTIQKMLEMKGCANSLRSTVQCSQNTSTQIQDSQQMPEK